MAKQSGPHLVCYRDVLKSPNREGMYFKMSQGKPFFFFFFCHHCTEWIYPVRLYRLCVLVGDHGGWTQANLGIKVNITYFCNWCGMVGRGRCDTAQVAKFE